MKFGSRQLSGALAGLTALSLLCGGTAYADPPQDTLTKLNDLSRQALQLTEAINSAKSDLDTKLQLLGEADSRHSGDLAALEAAKADLATHQGAVDKLAAAVYMGGTTNSANALLTARSPQFLIDKLAVQRVMADDMTGQLQSVRRVSLQAQSIEEASARSAADARAAVDAATAVRADLLSKQSQLRARVAEVSADYAMMPQAQRAELPPSVVAALGLAAPIPTVGMGGLVPNARGLAAYIMATYPGVKSIGGVRSDPLPDHPSGHAIDIMIGSDMGLGDAINADVQSQSARFGVNYTMWRVASHYDHVHVTVS